MVKKTFKISDFEYLVPWRWRAAYTHIYIHLENRVIVCHIIAYWQIKSTVLIYEETGWKENFFIYTFFWLKPLTYTITEFFYDTNKWETKELKNFQSSCNLTDSHLIVVQWLTILSLPAVTSTCFYRMPHMTTFNLFCLNCVENICSLEPLSELEGCSNWHTKYTHLSWNADINISNPSK
jgi:hypothetical protein